MSAIARNRAFEDVSSATAVIKPPWSEVQAMTDREVQFARDLVSDRGILPAALVVVRLLLVSAVDSMASFSRNLERFN
jgi:hypothetical protein